MNQTKETDWLMAKLRHRLDQITRPKFEREDVEELLTEIVRGRTNIDFLLADGNEARVRLRACLDNLRDAEVEIGRLRKDREHILRLYEEQQRQNVKLIEEGKHYPPRQQERRWKFDGMPDGKGRESLIPLDAIKHESRPPMVLEDGPPPAPRPDRQSLLEKILDEQGLTDAQKKGKDGWP